MVKDTNLNLTIEQVGHTKFIGAIINSKLTWHDHVKLVSSKVHKSIGLLSKICYNLSS